MKIILAPSGPSKRISARVTLLFLILAIGFWSRVLFTGQVLLPGEMLSGFLPFGGNPKAPWTILQWDALAQYFPWRHFAAQSLQSGKIPLWNPYEFTGTPFLANGQSAVFYPLNFPFWILGTAYAFGVVAFLHTLLALFGTYALARHWKLSRAASVLSALAYAFCGYLSAWALLPTLFATACWLPLCLWLFELSVDGACDSAPSLSRKAAKFATPTLALSLACALLAGHAQIFFYVLLALLLRQPFLRRPARGLGILLGSTVFALLLGAGQLIPTLELARLGHRAGGAPTSEGWDFVHQRALQLADLPSLIIPQWPVGAALGIPSLNENFGYVGIGAIVLAIAGLFAFKGRAFMRRPLAFALTLTVFGLLYGLATPLAQLFFFGIPGLSQMGGTGRALLLWSLGVALLAGFGLDFLRAKFKNQLVIPVALAIVALELFSNAFLVQPTAPASTIYPQTALTDWFKSKTNRQNRVLFYTPRGHWLATEMFPPAANRTHPDGVLPPNGATVYGIYEVNGYDSLSPKRYREWISSEEEGGPSPELNGNMVLLNNLKSQIIDSLSVRWVVVPAGFGEVPNAHQVFIADGCEVWERTLNSSAMRADGDSFYPGFRDGQYAPETFRFGIFISLCALSFCAATLVARSQTKSKRASSL